MITAPAGRAVFFVSMSLIRWFSNFICCKHCSITADWFAKACGAAGGETPIGGSTVMRSSVCTYGLVCGTPATLPGNFVGPFGVCGEYGTYTHRGISSTSPWFTTGGWAEVGTPGAGIGAGGVAAN